MPVLRRGERRPTPGRVLPALPTARVAPRGERLPQRPSTRAPRSRRRRSGPPGWPPEATRAPRQSAEPPEGDAGARRVALEVRRRPRRRQRHPEQLRCHGPGRRSHAARPGGGEPVERPARGEACRSGRGSVSRWWRAPASVQPAPVPMRGSPTRRAQAATGPAGPAALAGARYCPRREPRRLPTAGAGSAARCSAVGIEAGPSCGATETAMRGTEERRYERGDEDPGRSLGNGTEGLRMPADPPLVPLARRIGARGAPGAPGHLQPRRRRCRDGPAPPHPPSAPPAGHRP